MLMVLKQQFLCAHSAENAHWLRCTRAAVQLTACEAGGAHERGSDHRPDGSEFNIADHYTKQRTALMTDIANDPPDETAGSHAPKKVSLLAFLL